MFESGEIGGSYSIGKVFYRMRMRKSIEEALKWFEQKKALKIQRDPSTIVNMHQPFDYLQKKRSKVVTI